MATELKTTIKIDVDGVSQFLDTTKQVNKELLQIEKTLQKQGFKGNEKELKASAKAYRDAMIKASRDVEKAELKRIDKTTDAQRTANKIISRLTIGRGVAEFAQRIIGGLSDIIEKNKETDVSIRALDKSFNKVKDGAAKLGLSFLQLVSGPIVSFINGLETLTYALAGWDLEAQKNIDVMLIQKDAFNSNIEALTDANISQDERLRLITLINSQYGQYLPFLLNEKSSLEDLKIAQDAVNRSLATNINLLQEEDDQLRKTKANLARLQDDRQGIIDRQRQREAARELLAITKEQLLVKKELNTINGDEARKLEGILKDEKLRTEELRKQDEIRRLGYERVKSDVAVVEMGIDNLTKLFEDQSAKGLFEDAASTLELIDIGIKQAEESYAKLKQTTAETGELEAAKLKLLQEQKGLGALNVTKAQVDAARVQNEELRKTIKIFDALPSALTDITDTAGIFVPSIEEIKSIIGSINETLGGATGYILDANAIYQDRLKLEDETKISLAKQLDSIRATIQANNEIEGSYKGQVIANSRLLAIKGEIAKLDAEIAKKEKDAGASGIRAAEELAKLKEKQSERTIQLALAQVDSAKEILDANIDAVTKIRELTRARGVGSIQLDFELFDLQKASEDVQSLGAIQSNVKKVIDKYGEDAVRFNEATNTLVFNRDDLEKSSDSVMQLLINSVDERTELIAKQNAELLEIQSNYTEEELKAFRARFKGEEQVLTNALKEQEQLIRGLQDDLLADRRRFDQRAIRDDRDYNDEEIAILQEHTRNLIAEENKRFNIEADLRIRAYLTELKRIAKNGGDVEVLTKSFQLQEADLFYQHTQNMVRISEGGAVEIKENTKKAFLTAEEAAELFLVLEQAFSDVFAAYVSYQDSVAQKAIDGIRSQLDFLNNAISETTSNIDSLEADLEGKRSGRREAILRGLEIEEQRQKALTDKKISLEQQLRLAEKKASDDRKAAAISQALINGAVAVTNVWANSTIPYPAQAVFGAIQTAALATITGFQIAEIENQTFADGGMLDGPSHSQGGIPFTVNGTPGFEAEGGEAIMSRRTVDMFRPQLHAMQVASGSKGLYADGGMLGANFTGMGEALNGSSFRQIQMIADRPTYVRVTDINNLQGRTARVTDITSL